ncbi:MAG: HNH endonuclease, partial [Alphaproteobacteria bacterium]
YAGKVYPLEKLPEELRQKYPHSVPFTGTGHPDFSRYAVKKVEIKMTGVRHTDDAMANKIAGFKETPKDYTWHHHHDGETMMLVPKNLHRAVNHTGGVAIVKGKQGK